MKQILANLQKEKTMETTQEQKDDLLNQRKNIEERIKRVERKETDDKVLSSLRKIQEINDSLSDIQNSLNLVWKRTQQVEQELKEALTTVF